MKGKIRWIILLVSIFMIISLSRSVVDLWERRNIVQEEQKRLSQLEKKHEELTGWQKKEKQSLLWGSPPFLKIQVKRLNRAIHLCCRIGSSGGKFFSEKN
ncbi:MAG: hypothetical protein UV63_C0043G0002 [Microgenomates group bacterium GW2011_GWC1_43_11]|nr:MAG: hypothetical protein UV63_C0043G0002 [Microgenomates group bacterium GW2011_GWC1_43_11]